MENDLIIKIRETIAKNDRLKESDIRSLMVMVRKLLDKMPNSDWESYLIIRLYCNWVVHNEITYSNTGLRILAEINDAFVNIKDSKDSKEIRTKISSAIGYPVLRKELKLFFSHIDVDDTLVADNILWANFITVLIEIIRDVPLSFPRLSELDATKRRIYEQIVQNPIIPGAWVISIQISLEDYDALGIKGTGNTMCIRITTEDTTTTVIPLLIDVRL